jgi:rhamnulose-1-phosphate aldolase/alcohol dehydrogenase
MRGNLWSQGAPPEDRPLDVLIYRSRLIGSDPDLVLWGGGNTSAKTVERDHLGRIREVLRIKGSGTDLKTIDRSGFPGVFRDEVLPLLERDHMSDEEVVAYLGHCVVDPTGPRPSIETLLHAFLPARHVDHVHADAIVALTDTERGPEIVREALGEQVAYVPYRRPGFVLSRQVFFAAAGQEAVVLGKHGLVTWGETGEESYARTIELVERAEAYLRARTGGRSYHLAPLLQVSATSESNPALPTGAGEEAQLPLQTLLLWLRGRLGHVVLHSDTGPELRAIADRPDVHPLAQAGPATPDHMLRIRPWACVIEGDPAEAVDEYERRYRAFFSRYAEPGQTMLDPRPKVFLVPGLGMITSGRNALDARTTAEVALHTLRVAALAADAHGSYQPISEEDIFHVEYWPLQLYKLTLAPAWKELEGRIVLVTGAASGIGRATARHLARLGAQLALLDLNSQGLQKTSALIVEENGPAAEPLPVTVDLTDASAVADAIRCVVTTYGGIDALVSNAGIGAGGKLVDLSPLEWRRSLEVNTTSHFLVTAEVLRAMAASGLGGSLVYIASKNAFGPGAGFGAYSAAKAAEVQLARIAALEGGPLGIRSNIVNPDAVFEDSGLWSEEVRAQRAAAHGVPIEELEQFYAQRNLLKTTISGRDVAEAVAFLVSDRSKATTGTVITVDGGVAAAFPR